MKHFKLASAFCMLGFTIFVNAQAPVLVSPVGHLGNITSFVLSADNKYLLTHSKPDNEGTEVDNTAKLWMMNTGELLYSFRTYGRIKATLSPDNGYVLTLGPDNNLNIWSTRTGMISNRLEHPGEVYSAGISPDGKFIASASADSMIRIWDGKTFSLLLTIPGLRSGVTDLQFSPSGKFLTAISTEENKAATWEVPRFRLVYEKSFKTGEMEIGMTHLTFSGDGSYFCTYGHTMTRIWETASGKIIIPKETVSIGGESEIAENHSQESATFSAGNKFLITTHGLGRDASIWNVTDGSLFDQIHADDLLELADDNAEIKFSAFNQINKNYIVFTSTGHLYTGIAGDPRRKMKRLVRDEPVYSVSSSFTKDGRTLICAINNSVVALEGSTLDTLWTLKQNNASLRSLTYSGKGKLLAASYSPGIMAITGFNDPFAEKVIDPGLREPYSFMSFIGESDSFIAHAYNEPIACWDAGTLKESFSLKERERFIDRIKLSPSGNLMFSLKSGVRPTVAIYDTRTGKEITTLKTNKDLKEIGINNAVFNQRETKLITWDSYIVPVVWDLATGEMAGALLVQNTEPRGVVFTPDDKRILVLSKDGLIRVFSNDSSYQLISTIGTYRKAGEYTYANLGSGGNKIFLALEHDMFVLDINTYNVLGQVKVPLFRPDNLSFPSNDKFFVINDYSDSVRLYSMEDYKLVKSLPGNQLDYPAEGSHFIIRNLNAAELYGKNGFKKLASISFVNNANFITTPEGYYSAPKSTSGLLHYVKGLQVISFDQLDLRYNRPDKVLEAVDHPDTALIRSYRNAWEKRIRRMGIDTLSFREGFTVPLADFANRDNIAFDQKSPNLKLHIKALDSVYKLDRFNIWVNEVPVFGAKGISIQNRFTNTIDTTISIVLSKGLNRVETSVYNINGIESYRMPVSVNYSPMVTPPEKLYFIGIGIDQFADNRYNLQYSSKDIRDLAMKLRSLFGPQIVIDTLFNEQVTVANVRALKKKLSATSEQDKVIISYSGHGLLNDRFDYFLSTYEINFDDPGKAGLPYEDLEDLLDSIPARRKLMLIDACHSGEVDKDGLEVLAETPDSLIKGLRPVAYKKEGSQLGLRNSFELMQNLFVNVGKSTGATIISAAAGTEFALERNELRNGVFTYCILEAMKQYPSMMISDLKRIVSERVEKLTNGLQKPTSRNETITSDWQLW